MISPQLSSYVFVLGAETANTVKLFTAGANLAVYEGPQDAENDARLRESYRKAADATRTWLRAVLAAEIMEARDDICVEAQLFLPDRLLEAEVHTAELPFGRGSCNAPEGRMLTTPIGRVDHFTYKVITRTPDNPVQILYQFFRKLLRQIHVIMAIHSNGSEDLLTGSLLEEHGIVDVLGVHHFDSLWFNVDEFLDKRLFGSGVS